ncbi:MAG: dTDP-4-dehydrorhamnose 3,5-epimerase [Bacteroidales bacterium]|nr:dTDP-4-dehydrorhamnose 3,5-epimerase [Bacteroidales bacterium]
MEIIETAFEGLLILKPSVFTDHRGYFFESFRVSWLRGVSFVQDNDSRSARHVLRGLHFQNPPHAQGKLIRVIYGSALDVAVDIRNNSPTFGQWFSRLLSGDNHEMLYIPPGFAHGFLSLKDHTVLNYKCTAYFHKDSEGSLRWNDPELSIDWGVEDPVLADKDRNAPLFRELKSNFEQ